MLSDEITVFDIKYNEAFERLNNLLSDNYFPNSIKNYVERYKLDKSRENRIVKKNYNTNNSNAILRDDKRKQIVDLYEIRDHDKKVQQLLNKNYLKNEIEWFNIKKREDEHKNKYNYNKSKYENESSINDAINNKDIIRNNNLKKKKFSNLANKVNIDKFIQMKKLNKEQNSYSVKKNREEKSNNYKNINEIKDGVFIPYSEFKNFEKNNKNRTIKINMKQYNINKKNQRLNINLNNIDNIKNLHNYNSNTNIKKFFSENNKKNLNINKNNNIYNEHYLNSNSANKKINKNSQSQDNKKRIKKVIVTPIELDKRYKIEKRKPLDQKIDYLREKKSSSPDQKVKPLKIYKSNNLLKYNNNDNIEMLNFQSKKYEDKAKMQEQLMRVKGNTKYGNEDNVKLSNLLIDSISTKLAILNQISSKNN